MLLKIIGSTAVFAASSFLGHVISGDLKRRPQQLRELQGLLQMFENEISYLSNILSDAFEKIHKASSSPIGEFFKITAQNLKNGSGLNASIAWEIAVKENIKSTALNSEDKGILISFGKMLGSTDLQGQLKNIRLTINQLKLQEEKAEETRGKNEAMYKRLGILGGAAIVLILL